MLNKQGGLTYTDKSAIERAKKVDLITLPFDIEGTRCDNCKYFTQVRDSSEGHCTHEDIDLDVTDRIVMVLVQDIKQTSIGQCHSHF